VNIQQITECAEELLEMVTHYKSLKRRGELGADLLLYGLLQGRFGHMTRQHPVKLGRIDFRYGASAPVVIELVHRGRRDPRAGLFASQNRSEIRKLTRVTNTTARTRILLLIDRSSDSIPRRNLKPSYDATNAGRGRFTRHSIRVIYVSRTNSYNFIWCQRRLKTAR